jgi:predicted glycoside hydrolase/deacetylase ChbG (UPF0249 family)
MCASATRPTPSSSFRWGPVTPRTLVPSLVGPDGFFYSTTEEFARHAKLDEVETEVRAQIERAKSMGLDPTHLDAHMHALYATPELFAVLRKVARDYRLPIRMARNEQVFRDLLPYVDAVNYPVWDAAGRQRDVDVISSPEFRKALADNHVILIGWRPIQKLIQR